MRSSRNKAPPLTTRMLSICQLGGNSIAGLEAMVTWGSGTRPIAFPPDTTRLSTTTCPHLGSEGSSLGFPRSGSERALVAASRQNSNKLQDIEAESRLSLRGRRGPAGLISPRHRLAVADTAGHCSRTMSAAEGWPEHGEGSTGSASILHVPPTGHSAHSPAWRQSHAGD